MTTPAVTDHWLDEVTEPATPAFGQATGLALRTFAGPARLLRRASSFALTTPGKLTIVTVFLILAIVAAGASMAKVSSQRHDDLNHLLTTTEPMSDAAHNLYTSLSLADTIASTGFVQSGVETQDTRDRYYAALDEATISATRAVAGSDPEDERVRELSLYIQRQLPVYAGMVETARANHRMGNSVAATYMTNASALMREEIMPAAEELFSLTSESVARQQGELTRPQWVPLSGLAASILFLLGAQVWLWRLTRRRLNRGFLAATALMFVAFVWVSAANIVTWTAGVQRFTSAAVPWNELTASQIAAQRTRTDETLALVTRQAETQDSFAETSATVTSALNAYEQAEYLDRDNAKAVELARGALKAWELSHNTLLEDISAGRYDAALHQATTKETKAGTPTTSASAFNQLDDALRLLVDDTRASKRLRIEDSLRASTALGGSVGVLTLLASIAVLLGNRPRLQEYL